ncbi:tyrosine-type recombinase/integrase [Desulfallas thermosapovorans]|uniref:Site-specific recombinase XerD n=1 Tax=Desulfallas thermosapovorans DSM 6562 TaxID=1121431 RepID=A0A5S4ZY47_9FIRM|nr:tyrosine-type recombinase/integrase [Desulfallas thermosapovorans]TYO97047.1 site-specific recombinase XerD [Desulfallas thermosapovorans DSM 6562]
MAGWVEKRGTNKWRLNVPGGTGPDGRRKVYRRTIEATSEREAKKQLDIFSAEVQKGQYVEPSKLTFAEFSQQWLESKKDLAPKTRHRYKRMLESRILPAMGHMKLESIKPFHIMQFYENLQESGIREDGKEGTLSPTTILHHHRLLVTIFNAAVKWQILLTNPAARVEAPKVPRKPAACYDENDIAALLEALDSEELKHRVLVYIALFTGLRRGEIMGLEWQDVDFDNSLLHVRRSSQYLPGQGSITKEPKNETSKRVISIPSFVMALIKQYKTQQSQERLKLGDLWQGSDRLFTTWDGKPGHPEWPSQWFSKFIKKHKLPHLPFHGLRHTAATMLINQNIPLKNISGRLGHANPATTGAIYSHYLQSADKAISDKLENAYQHIMQKDTKKRQV